MLNNNNILFEDSFCYAEYYGVYYVMNIGCVSFVIVTSPLLNRDAALGCIESIPDLNPDLPLPSLSSLAVNDVPRDSEP